MLHCKLATERPTRLHIKNSIYSRKKSPFEQKVTGAPFAGSLLPGLVPIRDLEVRHLFLILMASSLIIFID